MNRLFAIFALSILVASVYADYSAQLPQQSAALTIDGQKRYFGHYGNYYLFVGKTANNAFVRISGPEESAAALELELNWLSANGMLATNCEPSKLTAMNETGAYCNEKGEWLACSSVSLCEQIPPYEEPKASAPAALPSIENIVGGMGEAASQKMTAAQDAGAARTGEPGFAAPPQPQGISAEQMVQLLGALFAVIVVSYLLLQQKGPEITPQDLQLLSNETRSGILHELEVADKIPTDLSNKLGKSKATVVEHLETLASAGFVEKIATPGKKYVFYRLTRKGKIAILRKAA
ncbi:MAG: winged helix-turn-helix domain-containing protein [Candidatus Anstonellaceae archaeon]